jgi:multidrug transporter EmrE-like cation transporter
MQRGLTAVRATLIYRDSLTPATCGGVALIVVGVPLVELGSHRQPIESGGPVELAVAVLPSRPKSPGHCSCADPKVPARICIAPITADYLSLVAFVALTLTSGVPVGIGYGGWAAAGIVLTAGIVCKDPLTPITGVGIIAHRH